MKFHSDTEFASLSPVNLSVLATILRRAILMALIFSNGAFRSELRASLPLTGAVFQQESLSSSSRKSRSEDLPSLPEFIATIRNGEATVIRGVYAPGLFALPVVQQPESDFGFVSSQPEALTTFQLAEENHVIGLLAHNYLSGRYFFDLSKGHIVIIIKGDGSQRTYRVSERYHFKRLDPEIATSRYLDLTTRKRFTTRQVFNRFYRGEHHVTFQTCLEREGDPYWGLLFIVALPLDWPQ